MDSEAIWKAASWLSTAAVTIACIIVTRETDWLQLMAIPILVSAIL